MLTSFQYRPFVRSTFMRTAVLAGSVGLMACNTRFHADFETDSPDAPPALEPAGPPDDRILIEESGGGDDSIVIRVTDEPALVPTGPHRFMSLVHDPNPGSSSVALLQSSPMATSTQSIFVQWEQILDGGGVGLITFFAQPGDPPPSDPETCRVTTDNDVMTLECGRQAEQIGGFDTHAVHTVLMRFDRSPRRAVLQVSQGGSTTAPIAIQAPDAPAPVEAQRFVAQIEHQGQSGSAYRFDRFDIQERDPH
jgi:hypothetical protein